MSKHIELVAKRTYATKEGAIKAAQKSFQSDELRFIVVQDESGRWFPVFIGQKSAEHQVFRKFHVVF